MTGGTDRSKYNRIVLNLAKLDRSADRWWHWPVEDEAQQLEMEDGGQTVKLDAACRRLLTGADAAHVAVVTVQTLLLQTNNTDGVEHASLPDACVESGPA